MGSRAWQGPWANARAEGLLPWMCAGPIGTLNLHRTRARPSLMTHHGLYRLRVAAAASAVVAVAALAMQHAASAELKAATFPSKRCGPATPGGRKSWRRSHHQECRSFVGSACLGNGGHRRNHRIHQMSMTGGMMKMR